MKTNARLLILTVLLATTTDGVGQPVIIKPPDDQNAYVGESVTFAVTYTYTGDQPVFQWRFNAFELLNERNKTLQLSNVQFADTGDYWVVITDSGGSVVSPAARLEVLPDDVSRAADQELRFGQPSAPIWEAPRIDDEGQSITPDGLTIYYGSKAPGGSGKLDIWMTTRPTLSSPWSTPINLGPTVNSAADDNEPRLSPDGLSLYFSSNRPGGYGDYDLWVARRSGLGDPFGTPVNLGQNVNSSAVDFIPNISADNRILVFGSYERQGGLGSSDVWMTTRTNAQAPWEPARSLDKPVSSGMFEFPVALSRDGLLLFIKAERPGDPFGLLYVSRRANRDLPFSSPALIRPIRDLAADYSTLSDDGATLYVGRYRYNQLENPGWPQIIQINITTLPRLRIPGRSAAGELQLELTGREGANYEIEVSPDFSTWTPWLATNTTTSIMLSDPTPAAEGHRFYRASSH